MTDQSKRAKTIDFSNVRMNDIIDLFGEAATSMITAPRERVAPKRNVRTVEVVEEPTKRQRVEEPPVDEVDAIIENTIELAEQGAPDVVITSALQRVQELIPTTPLKKQSEREKRLRTAVQFLVDHIEKGRTLDDQSLIASFAALMGYTKELNSQQYAQLSIDLAVQSIIDNSYESDQVKAYLIHQQQKARSSGSVSLGVVQRLLYNIHATVRQYGQMLSRSKENSFNSQHQSPYTRAYAKYFNDSNDDNRNFYKFVVRKNTQGSIRNIVKVHEVDITKIGDKDIATVSHYKQTAAVVDPTAFYRTTVEGVDLGYVNALKISNFGIISALPFTKYIDDVINISRNHFFGRGDITSLALRLVKVFKVYTWSNEEKLKYHMLVDREWVFRDAMLKIKRDDPAKWADKVSQTAEMRILESDLDVGVWRDGFGVGASGYQRALWYFSDYLGYGCKWDQGNRILSSECDIGLNGLIGLGSNYTTPSRWILAFYKKVYASETDASDADLLNNFLLDEDGKLYRFVSTGKVNPINLNSEAGCPYPPRIKKINALADSFRMADIIYNYLMSSADPNCSLFRDFPELYCVVIKPKAEVFPFETPVPVEGLDLLSQNEVNNFARSNEYLPKGRGIFVPCPWASIPFGFITSFISHNYESKFEQLFYRRNDTTTEFYEDELNAVAIPLKDVSFAYGMFDFFFRRVQCLPPFNTEQLIQTQGFGYSSYADNGYAYGAVDFAFETEEDTITLKLLENDTYETIIGKTMVPAGTEVFLSIDGEKAESATDEPDVIAYLNAMCNYFLIPADVSAFIMKAARFGINGGIGIFGDKQINMPWQGSGNQLTFSLNDWKVAQVFHHYVKLTPSGQNGKWNWPLLKHIGSIYGLSLTLERVVFKRPLGQLLVKDDEQLDVDVLGLSAALVNGSNFIGSGLVVAPILAYERRIKAQCFSKGLKQEHNLSKEDVEAAVNVQSSLNFAIKAISLLLAGCVLINHEKDICYKAICMQISGLYSMFNDGNYVEAVKSVVDDAVDLNSLLQVVGATEFRELLQRLLRISDQDSKLEYLDAYFVPKYLSLVSCPATFCRRTAHLLSTTRLTGVGAAPHFYTRCNIIGRIPNIPTPVTSQPSLTSKAPSRTVYEVIAAIDAKDPRQWPSQFKIGPNGCIKEVTFNKTDPVFLEKQQLILDRRNVSEQDRPAFLELFRESLRWYIVDHPHRSSGYDAALALSEESRETYQQNLIAGMKVYKRVKDDAKNLTDAFYMRSFSDDTQKLRKYTDESVNALNRKINSGQTSVPPVNTGKVPSLVFLQQGSYSLSFEYSCNGLFPVINNSYKELDDFMIKLPSRDMLLQRQMLNDGATYSTIMPIYHARSCLLNIHEEYQKLEIPMKKLLELTFPPVQPFTLNGPSTNAAVLDNPRDFMQRPVGFRPYIKYQDDKSMPILLFDVKRPRFAQLASGYLRDFKTRLPPKVNEAVLACEQEFGQDFSDWLLLVIIFMQSSSRVTGIQVDNNKDNNIRFELAPNSYMSGYTSNLQAGNKSVQPNPVADRFYPYKDHGLRDLLAPSFDTNKIVQLFEPMSTRVIAQQFDTAWEGDKKMPLDNIFAFMKRVKQSIIENRLGKDIVKPLYVMQNARVRLAMNVARADRDVSRSCSVSDVCLTPVFLCSYTESGLMIK